MNPPTETEPVPDARLVELSLAGQRDAFAEIVARYQSLICSISYSACGDVERSQDLAQDTFVAAWKDLPALKEPGRLKSWLCGIARNLIHNSRRREMRTPTGQADPLHPELACAGASPAEQTMSKEEEALVWRALETIPPDYREPLILFYREGQSVQAVAAALDLTDDAVRQRLSRGRGMLHERVARTVESALRRSAPGGMFVVGVLAALPALSLSAKAATLGAAAAKGGAAAKTAAAVGLGSALLTPLLHIFGLWIGYRASLESAGSDRERGFVKGFYRWLGASILGFSILLLALISQGPRLLAADPHVFIGLAIALGLAYAVAIAALTFWTFRIRRRLLAERTAQDLAAEPDRPLWEYRSPWRLLGLPFIHIRIGDRLTAPIKAWIASGNCAFGVLFAFGGLAVAPISLGGCAIGLFSFGGFAAGALVLGGFGVGLWSFSGMAIGWQAFGGCVLAWNSAVGGIAIARDFALGGLAHATQANNAVAEHFVETQPFFRASQRIAPYIFWLNLLWVGPLLWQRRFIARLEKPSPPE
jgi:RNA polymerase sigma factor (sigma-70 family)